MLEDDAPTAKGAAGGVQAQKRKALQTSYSPESSRLRLACDRCHAHKLRCLRSESTEAGGKCDRCRRAAVQCIYSPPNRLGRPARSGTGQKSATPSAAVSNKEARNSPRSSPRNTNVWPSPKSPQPPSSVLYNDISTHGPNMDILAEDSGTFEDLHLSGSQLKLDMMPLFNSKNPTFEDSSIDFNGQVFSPESVVQDKPISFAGGSNAHTSGDIAMAEENADDCVRRLTDLGLAQYNQLRQLKRMRSCTSRDKQSLLTLLRSYPIHEIMETARQLTELADQFIQTPAPGDDILGSSSPDSAGEPVPDLESPFLSDPMAIHDFSDLLSQPFLDMLATPKSILSSSGSNSQHSPGTTGSGPQIDTSTMLHTISCYLRLARLFVLFFTDLHDFLLFPNLTDPILNDKSRLFPGLKLGSFQPYVGMELEISIVVQVSEHILNRLCNSLGLPQGQQSAQNKLGSEIITPAMIQAVQTQERLEAQDERGDTFTRLPLVIKNVKKMVKMRSAL
ncbi:uncharacterized protein GIQ15_06419 [Arthroderma uncinatum]|uniref:uncharacterized protein n=1 Tax=Arthroderma uncinatum TaxID=74035 RepID=UPI00144AE25B|nr:uncharacterized protein GIQ15_06419 [Arthroderma uncinatum]KAF3479443.1 hypothetical protein GIQ15_06419 [Arthroderma uncinatum]